MKIRKHRLSLAVGIIVMLLGLASGAASFIALRGMGGEKLPSLISSIGYYAGFPEGTASLVALSAFLFFGGLFILAFRKKKRVSMVFSILFLAVIYITVLAYSHLGSGNPHPEFLISRIDAERRGLLLICTVLEVLLSALILSVTGKADSRLVEREEKRLRRMELAEAKMKEEAGEASSGEDDGEEPVPAAAPNEKEDRRYQKMKEKMDRKQQRREEKLVKKDEKKAARLQKKIDKQNAAEESRLEKAREKEERKAAKAESSGKDEGDGENEFVTRGAETPRRNADPSAPVDIPEVGDLPHLKKIRTPEGVAASSKRSRTHEAAAAAAESPAKKTAEASERQMPPESDVFSAIKGEIEREEEEKKRPAKSARTSSSVLRPQSFRKGGMLEATLESLMGNNNDSDGEKQENADSGSSDRRPIIGFEEKRNSRKERKNNSSFAPSGLSPEHPRYKMFEALAGQNSVSSFPSKSFEPAEEDPAPAVQAVHVPESRTEKHHSVRRIPGQSGFLKDDDNPSDDHSPEVNGSVAEEPSSFEIEEAAVKPASPKRKPAVHHEEEESAAEAETLHEESRHPAKSAAEAPAKASKSVAQDDAEVSDMPQQEHEFLLSVGVGGLQSNELGYAGISQRSRKKYSPPPLNILVDYPQASREIDDFTRERGEIIVDTLAEYHIAVTLSNIIKGPTVTMYELELGEGILVNRIKARIDELSYNLGGVSIRILAPVPGRKAVGIEVPNKVRATIGFKDMLMAVRKNPESSKLRVPMILGRTIMGEPVTIDVSKMPHMLIAGSTGSGKSVCINSFISSLIYLKSPQEVRLIMVDPKVVELTVYNDIPHLLTPVITDSGKVVKALGWLCDEMDRRYQMLATFGVRNIEGLNAKIRNENIPAEKLPYIVLIMDEFADLMSVVGKDIETYVARLAAKARAAGIHLILATQRPSSDVVTGTIKNNFPARIAFAVSSSTNSRIILDENGAENLLGKGDMLLMEPSSAGFQRIQGAFLSDDEVYDIVGYAKKNGSPDYLADDIFEEPETRDSGDEDEEPVSDEDSDEVLYERAKQIVFERKCASASFLQRRMKIGYNRAARLIEMMEDNGIIGPANGSKPREILKYYDD